MDEYINRDAVHDLVRSLTKYAWASPVSNEQRVTVDADDVQFGVDKIPSADVAPVRHGQWYMLDDCANAGVYCSDCGRRVHREEFAYKKLRSKYCPHCGAKMDGVDDG